MAQKKIAQIKNVKIKIEKQSLFEIGDKIYDRGDFFTAFRIFLLGAKEECKYCQMRLGLMYDDGVGIKSNIARAIYWYKKSNRNKDMSASATNLLLLYRDIGYKSKEMEYLNQSALLGNEDAQQEIINPEKEFERVKRQKMNRILKRRRNRRMIEKNKKLHYHFKW